MSLGASGALGKALVFLPWKGLDCVREYVVPSNPKSTLQNTQRGYLIAAVAAIHAAEADAVETLGEVDKTAYSLYASTFPTPRTWFNQMVMRWLLAEVNGEVAQIYAHGVFADVAPSQTTITMYNHQTATQAGFMVAMTSKTAVVETVAADGVANEQIGAFLTLTKGIKYYFQFRPTKVADDKFVARSGIYTHVQLA